jgi:Fic family protein
MLNELLKSERVKQHMSLRVLSGLTSIDVSLLSKYEHGSRLPSENHLRALAKALSVNYKSLRNKWLAHQIYNLLSDEDELKNIVSDVEYIYQAAKTEAYHPYEDDENIASLLKEVTALHTRWQAQKPLNAVQLQRMKEHFYTSYTYESNRIEGNTLTLQETFLVVSQGITIGGKSMREHLEAINHAEAILLLEDLIQQKTPLNRYVLLQLHGLILRNIDRENAGVYRRVPVRISGSSHVPPEPWQLDALMDEYFEQYVQLRKQLHPVLLAAEMHEKLVSIHPFIDGNGRTSRLVMNLVLLQNGYTIANLKGDVSSRMAYYQALEAVRTENSKVPFYKLVIEAVRSSLQEHLDLSGG